MGFAERARGWFGHDYVRLAAIVILVGTVLRFALAALSHPAGDSCWHLSVSRFIAENSRIPFLEPFGITDREVFSAPPLFHLAAAAAYRIFSFWGLPAADFAAKLASPLFGSLTLPFVFLLGRKMYNARIGFFATLFIAFLPLHINLSAVSFVESLAGLLAVAAVYFLLCRRIYLSAVLIGLGLASKQIMAFMLPLFFLALFFNYRHVLGAFLKKSVVSGIIIAAIGFPWYIRNYVLLGNPVWPFLYRIFGGKVVSLVQNPSIPLFSLVHPARFYLDMFGAPLGSLGALSFVSLPFQGFLVVGWLFATMLFFFPTFIGLFSMKRHRIFLYSWVALFMVVVALYIVNTGGAQARLFLPALPALAIIWAFGLDSILRRVANLHLFGIKLSSAVMALLLACILAFSSVELAKTVVGAKAWDSYRADFDWVRANTPSDALIGYRGQCLSYNVRRFSDFNLDKADYVWVNQGFRLEPVSIVEPEILQRIRKDFAPVYENNLTGTAVYERKK